MLQSGVNILLLPPLHLHSTSTPLTSTSSSAGHGGVIALFALHRILQQAGDGWPAEADVWLRIRTSDKKEVTGRHRPLLLLHRHLHLTSPAPSRYR